MSTATDFGVSAKKSLQPPPPPTAGGVGLGLKLQCTGILPKASTMMHHRPSSTKQIGGPGPMGPCNEAMGCTSMRVHGTCHDDDDHHHHHDGGDNIVSPLPIFTCSSVNTPLQPFDISYSTTAFNFQGLGEVEMAATLGFPFTAAQWKELERQAMIYKYMVASVPVPYELLLPIIQNLPRSHSPLVSQLRCSTKQDLEPGRCKRTDGKKWRCSRDVAPNQKYCERHMHRGRPRSRKHVELSQNPTNPSSSSPSSCTINNNNKKTRLPNPSPQSSNPCKVLGSTVLPSTTETPSFLDNMHTKIVNNRGLNWAVEGGSEQQWRQIMQTSHSVFNHDFEEDPPMNLLSFSNFGTSNNEYLGSEIPRKDFIDAWSTNKTGVMNDSSVCSTGNLSPSALNLSMAMALGNAIDDEFGQVHRGLEPTQVSSFVSHGRTPGGPLAEVLRPSVAAAASSNPASPYPAGDGSPPATTASSPSGVLQRTMLSLSDGSVCNSPTTLAASSAPTPEIVAFQWFT